MEESRIVNIENIFMANLTNIANIDPKELIIRINNVYTLSKKVPMYSHITYAFIDLYYTQFKKSNCYISYKCKIFLDELVRNVRLVNKYAKLVEIMVDDPSEYRIIVNHSVSHLNQNIF
jgi:hypothetical protein